MARDRDHAGWLSAGEQVRQGSQTDLLHGTFTVMPQFFNVYPVRQCEELAERAGPSDLLQDLCPRTVSHHPLPQQVSLGRRLPLLFCHLSRY